MPPPVPVLVPIPTTPRSIPRAESIARGNAVAAVAATDGDARLSAAPANDENAADAAATTLGSVDRRERDGTSATMRRAASAERAPRKVHVVRCLSPLRDDRDGAAPDPASDHESERRCSSADA